MNTEIHTPHSLRPTVGSLNLRITAPLLYTCNTHTRLRPMSGRSMTVDSGAHCCLHLHRKCVPAPSPYTSRSRTGIPHRVVRAFQFSSTPECALTLAARHHPQEAEPLRKGQPLLRLLPPLALLLPSRRRWPQCRPPPCPWRPQPT